MKKKTVFILFLIIIMSTLAAFSIYDHTPERNGIKQVVAFGDSLTYGAGDEKGSGYIDTLEDKLNDRHRKEFEFTNEAIYGLESSGILTQISDLRVSRNLEKADYFILFIGTNDLINSNGGNLENLEADEIERGKEVYLQNLNGIINILKVNNDDAPILLFGLYNPYQGSEGVEQVIDDWNREIQALITDEPRITFIPTNDLFKGKKKTDYFSDALHLNDQGYNLIANRVMEEYKFK